MIINFIGYCVINLFCACKCILTGKVSIKNVIAQSAAIGYDSLPIALAISLVAGAVLSLQIAQQFIQSGADAYIGGLISIAIIREMAPIFASLAIGARAGTAMTAEIGNMQVTEQIDALKALKVDPIAYLLVPRLIAGVIMVPLVTVLAEFLGIIGGMLVAKLTIGLHPYRYIKSVWLYSDIYDIQISLIKAMVFGLLISLICTSHGLQTKDGATGVGQSTIKAAIWTAVTILVVDLLLSWIFFA